jgi:ankyrin repeat protein
MRGVGLFNAKDNEGKTPAHHAAENGHADSLRVVHNGGGNLSAVDETGCCPSHYAVSAQHLALTYTQTHAHKPHVSLFACLHAWVLGLEGLVRHPPNRL